MSHLHVAGASLRFKNLLVVIKQTAFEEYTQVRTFARLWVTTLHICFSLLHCISIFLFLNLLLYRVQVKTPWPSAESIAVETSGTALQGAQKVCHGFVITVAETPSQFFLRQSRRIGSSTLGRY